MLPCHTRCRCISPCFPFRISMEGLASIVLAVTSLPALGQTGEQAAHNWKTLDHLKGHLSKTPFPTQIAQSFNICSKCPSEPKGCFVDWPSVRWAKTTMKSCLGPHCQQMKFHELVFLFYFEVFLKIFHFSHWKRQVVDCRGGSEGHPTQNICWSHSSLPAFTTVETAQVRFAKQSYLFKYADNSPFG